MKNTWGISSRERKSIYDPWPTIYLTTHDHRKTHNCDLDPWKSHDCDPIVPWKSHNVTRLSSEKPWIVTWIQLTHETRLTCERPTTKIWDPIEPRKTHNWDRPRKSSWLWPNWSMNDGGISVRERESRYVNTPLWSQALFRLKCVETMSRPRGLLKLLRRDSKCVVSESCLIETEKDWWRKLVDAMSSSWRSD